MADTERIVAEEGAQLDFSRSMSYGDYLHLDQILDAQHPLSPAHDEMLFIVQHQVAELWMKLADHEMQEFVRALSGGVASLHTAQTALHRVHHIQRLLLSGLEILYTLSPTDYMRIRAVLGRGSGQESPGFKRMLCIGNEVWPHFQRLLDERRRRILLEIPAKARLRAQRCIMPATLPISGLPKAQARCPRPEGPSIFEKALPCPTTSSLSIPEPSTPSPWATKTWCAARHSCLTV